MPAPDAVRQLVERFAEHEEAYRSGQYGEAQLREEFLNPFFAALGWDVYNRKGYADAYKEVIHEAAIKVGGRTKAPDYCFRVGGGVRSFFVEAKKPSVEIGQAPSPAYQLRRYAWSAKLPVSLLTDFDELAVYDCRIRPAKTDKASTARVLYYQYRDYLDRWDELLGLFSPEAIRRGALEKFLASKKVKKGTAEVDASFLGEIESWRAELARNFAMRNPDLSQRDLNFAVQRTVDRMVFLRICEDRGIEPYGTLEALQNGPNVYRRMVELFERADDRYNSGLFHFSPEKDRQEPPDEVTLTLALDDKPLKEILRNLYYPESPYEFSVLPVVILGQVYEQFLGKVIRLTKAHQAKVEEKPEVRKAGGVYYTPAYIVDYIVRNTVGKLLEGKTPQQAAKLRVLDPACGSGSFLIGAYQHLLDWHRDWYVADDPEKHARARAPRLYRGAAGDWRLTTGEKKRILLANVYGVDIDPQAVEVTKLSLLLKVLEGESKETVNNQLRFFHQRALPDLGGNIKCGNSLIGPDFYKDRQMSLLDEEERYRINVFDWHREFPEVLRGAHPGFDVVIGNPPYISIQTLNAYSPPTVSYLKRSFLCATRGNYDVSIVFVERGVSLLSAEGCLGFILPSKFFATDYGEPLRRLLSEKGLVDKIVDFRHDQVFAHASTYTCLLFLSRRRTGPVAYCIASPPAAIANGTVAGYALDAGSLTPAPWVLVPRAHSKLLEKLSQQGRALLDLPCVISRGSSTGADDVFVLRAGKSRLTTREGEHVEIEKAALRTPIYATDFGRYRFSPAAEERIVFPYELMGKGYALLDEEKLVRRFPKAYAYLAGRKKQLLKRKQYRKWYAFSAPRNLDAHERADLMVPLLANVGSFCLLPSDMRIYCPMASAGFTISVPDKRQAAPLFLLGLLNSRLLFWMLQAISNIFRGGWITCTKQYVGRLPVCTSDLSDPAERACHDKVVEVVDLMLSLHGELETARTDHGKTAIQRQIDATDRQIDRLVYELYGLSEEEIALVEEVTSE